MSKAHTMLLSRRALIASSLLLASFAVLAAPKLARKPAAQVLPRYGMLVFSDLCISPENGEFGGQRITLQRFAEVDTVLYEYTAGGLSWPVVASEVVIDPRGRQFYFTVQPPDEEERTIRGALSDDGKTLVLDGSYCNDPKVPMKLARVSDFGRAAGTCRVCPAPKNPPPAEAEPAQPQPQPSLPPQPLQKIEAGRTTASL
ncbi:hypothetical protein [Pseudoduganella danionis]|uniref:hypothetical protein n=1 Tax=Pseudoduganella danionis TaxID=1890295 RepID=UPI0035B1992C